MHQKGSWVPVGWLLCNMRCSESHRGGTQGGDVVLAGQEAHCEQCVGQPCLQDVWNMGVRSDWYCRCHTPSRSMASCARSGSWWASSMTSSCAEGITSTITNAISTYWYVSEEYIRLVVVGIIHALKATRCKAIERTGL